MVITLYTAELINDLRTKSHYEASNFIPDVEARYRAEAGAEKREDLSRCISEGFDRLRHRCWRFLKDEYIQQADNTISLPDQVDIELTLTERRAVNKALPLKEAFHTFVIEYALSKFYSDVHVPDLSNKHSLLAIDAGNRIDELLFTKLPPRV